MCVDEFRRMRVLRRRRIQDYQLRSTTDQTDLKAEDDAISFPDSQVDEVANENVTISAVYTMYLAENIFDTSV